MNRCKILFFATLKDRAGLRQSEIDLPPGITVGDLKSIISDQFPPLATLLPHALIAVNREYAQDERVIPERAEIAFFPPVSGGVWDV